MLPSTSTNERCGTLNDKTAFLKQLYGKEDRLNSTHDFEAPWSKPVTSKSSLHLGLNGGTHKRSQQIRTSPVNDLLKRYAQEKESKGWECAGKRAGEPGSGIIWTREDGCAHVCGCEGGGRRRDVEEHGEKWKIQRAQPCWRRDRGGGN